MQKITLFLWFDNQTEESMNFYVFIFRNLKALIAMAKAHQHQRAQ
jgi:predicted 3-demethylubiquinone-9 3-methyltransferase (glyoxalase superfamily)